MKEIISIYKRIDLESPIRDIEYVITILELKIEELKNIQRTSTSINECDINGFIRVEYKREEADYERDHRICKEKLKKVRQRTADMAKLKELIGKYGWSG